MASERPKIKEIKRLKDDGCSRVVTILPERGEKAHLIRGGMSHSDAFETIANIRPETADAMEDKYLKLVENLLN